MSSPRNILENWRVWAAAALGAHRASAGAPTEEEPPLRSELLSADQMEQRGKALAGLHTLASGRMPDQLLARLASNEAVLVEVCSQHGEAVTEKRRITPAAEWLLDNFYLIEEQIRTAKRHLPKGYSRELPRLSGGPSAGQPRVYDIALEIISHGDGRVDAEGLGRFVSAYQTVTPLKLGELWATPIMLRLAVIENLRRVAVRIASGWGQRGLAETWADRMLDTAGRDPKSLILVIADMARSHPPITSAFVAELSRRLQGRGPALALPLTWVEQRLSESNLTIEQLVQAENQQQAANQVTVSNSIGSLRMLGAIDWREFVETMSLVEQTLRADPGSDYRNMDFATRDSYRHATESIAKRGGLAEVDVARMAIALATARAASVDAAGGIAGERAQHVGYYLLDKGLPQLEAGLGMRLSAAESMCRLARRWPVLLYLGSIALLTALAASLPIIRSMEAGLSAWWIVPIAALVSIASSQLALAMVNWLSTLVVMPRSLPRMDFSSGVPEELRTLVVVPTMLTTLSGIDNLVEALEVRFLANRDEHLHFALLTDVADSSQEVEPGDAPLIAGVRGRIEELNEKYAADRREGQGSTFFVFHRGRRWNPQERVWMGYERKRGKLAALNALLRAPPGMPDDGEFDFVVGDRAPLAKVKYVITLDTDTQLPRDAARQFVGAMAHPLNRPRYDETKQRVTEGYGILQPRVSDSLAGTNRSRYARLCGGEAGIDPYTRAVSDVYQDVFGEGSFIGKGIFDVDAVRRAVDGRFPEGRILSHDLIEGCYARAGLLSDVQLYEDYPARYTDDTSRRHRWVRGDWQLAGWLLHRVPAAVGGRTRNPLSILSQWKLFDNLRRSLVPPALTLLLLLGWTVLSPAWFWTGAVLSVLLIPLLCSAFLDACRLPDDVPARQHVGAVGRAAYRHAGQLVFELAVLPHAAYLSTDAIVRTAWRMVLSHRRLLEWNPSGEVARTAFRDGPAGVAASFRVMWFGPALATIAALYLAVDQPLALAVALPLLALWFVSPIMAWWFSRPIARRAADLTSSQRLFLRSVARRTWAFFENFVGIADQWLPPDNYQASRATPVAHRTSPTNMGLALLANLSAYDFGYIHSGRLIERTSGTLRTMESLQRYRGHFYNWYDTRSLEPLAPLYVSTVDSGNLAGHLLTLRVGLSALPDERIWRARCIDGLEDTLAVLAAASPDTDAQALKNIGAALARCAPSQTSTLATVSRGLDELIAVASKVAMRPEMVSEVPTGERSLGEARRWGRQLLGECLGAKEEIEYLAPWVTTRSSTSAVEDGVVARIGIPTLRELAALGSESPVFVELEQAPGDCADALQRERIAVLQGQIALGSLRARQRIEGVEALVALAGSLADMVCDFLYDPARHLLAIGYNVGERRVDSSYYDLLASEARLATFVAIAQGHIPQESWFALGRLLTGARGDPVLLSWSGSMFEYLMPMLVMPAPENTLLDATCKAAVARQIEYGKECGVPWGVSESCYNTVDADLNYQYRAFGTPGLGLKRGLAQDVVVAPYASALALMVSPEEACRNLEKLATLGFIGEYGFYESIDYTPARQRPGQSHAVVRTFMAHHQGMSLLSLANLLYDRVMQRRFESEPLFRAIMLLLEERVPKRTTWMSNSAQFGDARAAPVTAETAIRSYDQANSPKPEVQLLSNGRYHVMVTHAGGGYSRWKDLDVTRWREDGTCDNWGTFCYIREIAGAKVWSTSHQPTLAVADRYEAIFSEGRAEFRRRDSLGAGEGYFDTHTDIVVSPEDDIELRRVRITNRSRQSREIDVTSYAEVVIAPAAADALHPAFSNLFVQTEILRDKGAILCTRRPRSAGEAAPWMLHLMVVHGAESSQVSYETDRSRFIGRARNAAAPLAMVGATPLSDTAGSVLDPIVAIRTRMVLGPDQSVVVDIVSGATETREAAIGLIDKYQDRHLADRVFDLTWTHCQVALRQINASEADSQLHARLAGSVIYANSDLRAEAAVLAQNRRGQSGLWGYAISGDLPIVLLQIGDAANIELVRQLVQAHSYWRLKGLAVDLVIWNEDHAGYRQVLQEQILALIAAGTEASAMDRPGGIFVRIAEQMSSEDRILLQSVARAVISDSRGTLAEQLDHPGPIETLPPQLVPSRAHRAEARDTVALPGRDLILSNGLGGFTPDGREYVVVLAPGAVTPAPWVNVLANSGFGTVVSEGGVAYTWSENAHEFRLTPWNNDPVGDASGEAMYLRDEETGHVWSPMPAAARAATSYVVRHGFGYSVFEARFCGVISELWVYVATDAAIKFSVLKVRNVSGRRRKLSVTGYVEWVLGDLRSRSAMHIATEIDGQSGALLARNPYNTEFPDRTAFFHVDDPARSVCGDRTEFLGRNGTLKNPAAMKRTALSGRVGVALDPCGAIRVSLDLADGQEHEVVFRLGVGINTEDAAALVRRFRGRPAARQALEAVWALWTHTLGTVQVDTPDASINVMANGWLLYQTLACRIWARSGYYQSGGAFGFRDQLQDAMALVHTRPALLRDHLLLCASRQFREGDVQHWWHPPSGRGVRTHCSDDYLWLPLAVCRYVVATGDTGVLDEPIPFLEGRPVNPEDDSYYDLPGRSSDTASLYAHCVLAIRHGLRFGERGLPLIGTGDWNDGMNLVGAHGRGESVWLGFFLCEVLNRFAPVAHAHDDAAFADFCHAQAANLGGNIDRHCWDGEWYRRAYFDDGTPLGSAGNAECQIDSLSQSWSVLSGAGDPTRARLAMKTVGDRLVRPQDGLIQLLDPPFDKSNLDPGYIRGYVPGVRENGGQYTHGAIWVAMAFAKLGERERAWEAMTLINPVNHGLSARAIARYKVEPYVVAADVYAVPPHVGRGGWTWYTGSAGWMYRLALESLLGVRLERDKLHIAPCIPAEWPGFKMRYRYRDTAYAIVLTQVHDGEARSGGGMKVTLDGIDQFEGAIPLCDDRHEHRVEIVLYPDVGGTWRSGAAAPAQPEAAIPEGPGVPG